MKISTKRRWLSLLLAFLMVLTLTPTALLEGEGTDQTPTPPTSFGIPPVSGADERWKRACNELILEYPYACVFPHGAISCSGEGEGLYDGYVLKNSAGRVIAIAIDFLLYGKN